MMHESTGSYKMMLPANVALMMRRQALPGPMLEMLEFGEMGKVLLWRQTGCRWREPLQRLLGRQPARTRIFLPLE